MKESVAALLSPFNTHFGHIELVMVKMLVAVVEDEVAEEAVVAIRST